MSLSYDWTPLSQLIADLKALVGLGLDTRVKTLETKPEPETYDDTALKTRVAALEAADAAGLDPATMARIIALENAVSTLSTQLAAYTASPVEPPVEPPAEEPPA
jgi:hypothetical protein